MSPDLHTLTGAYAAHALPLEEEREFEEHLRACDACAQEVHELEATTARLAGGVAVVPPPALKRSVMAHIATVRQLPPLGAPDHAVVVPLRRAWYRSPLGIAAAGLLVLTLGLSGFALETRHQLSDERVASDRITSIVADPSRQVRTATLAGGGSATVLSAQGRAVVLTSELAALPSDRDYQLWIIAGTKTTSVGLLSRTSGVSRTLVSGLPKAASVAISIEPDGGSEQPTTKPIAVIATA